MTDYIAQNWQHIHAQVAAVATATARDAASVDIMAVSKTFPLAAVVAAWQAGARHFGENYVQEGVEKIQSCTLEPITWHFIGPLQSNKTRLVATHFDWVHTVDRLKIAQRLNDQRPTELPPLAICIQVNISADPNKAGVSPTDLPTLAAAINALPHLELRGLMTIPALNLSPSQLADDFAAMAQLLQNLSQHYAHLDTLSMGMSDDLELAITNGSTCVRVGRGIFGERQPKGGL